MALICAVGGLFAFWSLFQCFSKIFFLQVLAIRAIRIGESEGAENPERREADMKT